MRRLRPRPPGLRLSPIGGKPRFLGHFLTQDRRDGRGLETVDHHRPDLLRLTVHQRQNLHLAVIARFFALPGSRPMNVSSISTMPPAPPICARRSEEHTSELQSL